MHTSCEKKCTALIAQSVCKYSLRIPPRPKSLLLRSTQLYNGVKEIGKDISSQSEKSSINLTHSNDGQKKSNTFKRYFFHQKVNIVRDIKSISTNAKNWQLTIEIAKTIY